MQQTSLITSGDRDGVQEPVVVRWTRNAFSAQPGDWCFSL